MKAEKNYDSTIMRIAGNLLSGVMSNQTAGSRWSPVPKEAVEYAVATARAIVAEVQAKSLPDETGEAG